jgi:hypothetical protein
VPLAVILEALQDAAARARRRGADGPRSLSYLSKAVDESWDLIRSGRLDPLAGRDGAGSIADARSAWSRARDDAGDGSRLHRRLGELLRRLEGGEDPDRVDRELERSLLDDAPAELVERIRHEVAEELAPFRNRLPPERLAASSHRAVRARLRRVLGLPRLPAAGDPA